MKLQTVLAVGLAAATANAHTIFQKVSVNGADQGQLVGLRVPPDDYPVYDVTSPNIVCQAPGSKSSTIINVPAGANVGTWWGHVFGGAQGANDPDNPIASSHKGPISVYLAKVDNAASTGTSGLKWFKVAHEGFNTGTKKWAVDTMISGGGWWYFTLPSCIANGNYLVRLELIALHSASSSKGAQFYGSCIQINVQNGGSFSPSSTVSFPGAYAQNDPGVLLSIYGNSGQPDMGGKSYPIPGPAPISCSGSSNGGGTGGGSQTTTSKAPTTTSGGGGGGGGGSGSVALYGQCGGISYTGPTSCSQGTCKVVNDYYYQCQT